MRWTLLLPLLLLLGLSIQCVRNSPVSGYQDRPLPVWGGQGGGESGGSSESVATSSGLDLQRLRREVNLQVDMVPKGTHGRKVVRRMSPRYITIHSTQNYTADADRHSLALKRGALRARKRPGGNRIGYLIWHFSVDDRHVVQHMPTNEQGEHADFDGPGNRLSIGVEMCENRDGNLNRTIDRTAKLTAYLMVRNGIPLNRVVPHYHWPRKGTSRPNKNCPHFLMDNGRPGRKWKGFLNQVNGYYKQINSRNFASQ